MATFQPDDLKDQALRRLATELDVAEAGRSRPDVEQEILQKYPNALLMSAILHSTPTQARSGNRDWGAWLAIGFAALTAITTAYIAYANSDSANTARESLNAEIVKTRESRQREEATTSENQRRLWQLVIVFKIIDEGTKANWHGITLNEIRTRYTTEAASSPHNLTIDDKNELAIRRLILSLMEHRLVYTTTANKYITAQTIITPKEDICRGKSVEKSVISSSIC